MTTALKTRHAALPSASKQKVTVVHSGARDAYQVALALEESGLLDRLVTDLFWPSDRPWAQSMLRLVPSALHAMMQARSESRIPSSKVHLLALRGLATLLCDKLAALGVVPHHLHCKQMRRADAALGRVAGRSAARNNTALLSYSYYAHDAFANFNGHGILFQLHPHPASMRRILLAELESQPQCAGSLLQEWELALPQADFDHLASEPAAASRIIAASSFTRSTLVENGIPSENITVIPYGVDCDEFKPDASRINREDGKLRLLFVGRINQRKGIQYLVDAIRLLNSDEIELTVCGRVVDDLAIFHSLGDSVLIRPDISREALIAAYQSADLFVFPSIAEGFGQVLLESLACGLPIVSTTRTAAPDLIESGREGFIVEPGQSVALANNIEWALSHRKALTTMRSEARQTAEQFTWHAFRHSLANTVSGYLDQDSSASISLRHEAHERSIVHAL